MLYVNPLESSASSGLGLNEGQRETMAFKELEQVFIYMLLQEMRKSVPREDLFGDSQARQTFEGFLDDSLSKSWTESGQLGLAATMQNEYLANQRAHALRASLSGQDSPAPADKGE